jgi:hypothetical protein
MAITRTALHGVRLKQVTPNTVLEGEFMRTSLRALALGSAAALGFAVLPGTPAFASGQQSESCRPAASTCTTRAIGVINPGHSGTIHVATSGLADVANCVRLKDNNTGVWVLNVNCTNWNPGNKNAWVSGLYGTSYTAYMVVDQLYTGTLYVANY